MALSASAAHDVLVAFQRFGLGAKPGGPARIGANPRAAVRAEVLTKDIAAIKNPALPTYAQACFESQMGFARADVVRKMEINARIDKQMSVGIGFVERLVIFWANHFAMAVKKADAVRGTIGQWERDVVRANVLGRFSDMLHGTIAHPAMIAYLENDDSVGPDSTFGKSRHVGLNENLAREVMELHTLGSGGGYSEADVTALAKILTGWSYVRAGEADKGYNGGTAANRGQFIFRTDWHQPGPITLMGKSYPALGKGQLERVLDDLALHPSTAEHIAFKLVRHFITDAPTRKMVDPLKQKFLETKGDLKAVSLALLDLPQAWSVPLRKLRTPYENAIAQFRAVGVRYPDDQLWMLANPLTALHQMLWEAPSPEGFSDDTGTWLNPDAMRVRLDIAQSMSWRLAKASTTDIPTLATSLFDAALSQESRDCIGSVTDKANALTLLFSTPEFQRR